MAVREEDRPPLQREDASTSVTDLSKDEVLKALAAAEFAAAFALLLDVMVTLDFGRMGICEPTEARRELDRFLKAANSWLAERRLPVAWIACIERARVGNLHAHIAIHVPGMRKEDGKLHGVRYRTHFRAWAREAIGRRVGEVIPKTVNVRCSLVPSVITHWISVGYLLKGSDRGAVLVSARNSPDGMEVRLGDILPFDYRDPGDVGVDRRLFISGNLGPSRRSIGAPPAAEFMLPAKSDISRLQVTSGDGEAPQPEAVRAVVPRPFRASVEDGVFDVRRIYGAAFVDFVIGTTRATRTAEADDQQISHSELLAWLDSLGV